MFSFRARLLVLGLALASIGRSNISAAEPAPNKSEEAAQKTTFSPEVEAKLNEFLTKTSKAKRRLWSLRMRKEIDAIAKATGLGEEGKEALETPAEQAADACIGPWSTKFEASFRRQTDRNMDQLLDNLDQLIAQADNYATQDYLVTDYIRPMEHPSWTETLRQTLTPEQSAAWEKEQGDRKRAFDKQVGDILKASVERTREQHSASILARSAEIRFALNLPNERAEKLDLLAKSIAEKTAENWRRRAEKNLFYADEDQRRQVIRGRQFYLPTEEKEMPSRQPEWKEGLAGLLSADELNRLQAAQEERRLRRVRAMGQVMTAQLDEQIAFTESQRQQFQPIAELLVKSQRWLFPEDGWDNYINFAPQMFFAAAAKPTEEQIRTVLDTLQSKRWQDLCTPKKPKSGRANLAELNRQGGGKAQPPPQSVEPEAVEQLISDFLYDITVNERKRVVAGMTLKAEDAARVAGLSNAVISRLQTAARGAAEDYLETWKLSMDQNVRANVGDGNPEGLKQRLAGMDDYYLQRIGGVLPSKPALWEHTVTLELTEGQRAAWQKEIDARNAYKDKSIISALLAEFDRKNLLTAEQWQRLEPFIAGIVKDYGDEISGRFSSPNGMPWYLQNYTMFIPFVAVSENDLKPILTKEQWDRWVGSGEFTNSTNYWTNIERSRPKRKEAK